MSYTRNRLGQIHRHHGWFGQPDVDGERRLKAIDGTYTSGTMNGIGVNIGYDNGNVTALAKESDQSVAARYHYGAFGKPIQSFENGIENPFRYSTKYQDKENGCLYYGYRLYDSCLGRWIIGIH